MEPRGINYFDDARAQNLILYGDEEHYTVPSCSFWYDILPQLLQTYIQCDVSQIDYEEIYDKDVQPLAKVFNKSYNTLLRILFYFMDTPSHRKATDEEIVEYQKRKDLLGIIANLYDKVDKKGHFAFKNLLDFLSHHQDYQIKLKDFLPKNLIDRYIQNFKGIFYLLAKEVKNKKIKEEIDKFKFVIHPKAIKGIPAANGFEIIKTAFTRSIIIFKETSFGIKQESLLWDLLTTNVNLVEGVFFIDCIFKGEMKTKAERLHPRVMFKNCTFESRIDFPKRIMRECNFIKCLVKGSMRFDKVHFYRDIRFIECNFTESSNLDLNQAIFMPHERPVENQYFTIRDCIFKGELFLKDTSIKCNLTMKNLAFFAPFHFDNTELGHNCSFGNFAFIGGNYPKIEHSKQILGELLTQYGYTSDASKLGLSKSNSKKQLFDYDAYQVAYNSGFLKPEYAAYFLGKSKVYLAKKRTEDKKKLVRDSIPFKVDGKDIQYPVEALLAFKAKDWDTLKNLRKKYPIPTE